MFAISRLSKQNLAAASTDRIHKELRAVGMTSFGMLKFATRYLPEVLHEDEHIKGVVYGRYAEGAGPLRLVEGMLIATDRRVIFLDCKPGFEAMDELTYEVVSGVRRSYAWPFSSITLHTKIGNYTLRFANKKCIDTFMQYIERRRLEKSNSVPRPAVMANTAGQLMDDKVLAFLQAHDVAVLSTIDNVGGVHGATVHYLVNEDRSINLLTKNDTQKARNIFAQGQAALTLYDRDALQTLQMWGLAAPEISRAVRAKVFKALSAPKVYGENLAHPPVTLLVEGAYTVLRFVPSKIRFSDFSQLSNH